MRTQEAAETACTLVRVRVRPRSGSERSSSLTCLEGGKALSLAGPDGGAMHYEFDKVYGESADQEAVFRDLAFVVDAALAGCNGTVLTYGQTGSGKTHTLFGSLGVPSQAGIVPRAVTHLGEGIAASTAHQSSAFRVTLSVVEIYCERIRCLLSGGMAGKDNLQVKTDKMRGVFVEGATEVDVFGEDEMVEIMAAALQTRAVGSTQMNEASSRSHCVVTILVEQSAPDGKVTLGKLVLVDLAGSERAAKTGTAGTQLAEGALINKSLSALANVIAALTDTAPAAAATSAAMRHVPFRDSKLTRVLQDSLGGTARTVLICCCSAAAENTSETLSTLRFGARAKGMTCRLQVNQRLSAGRLQQLLGIERAQREALSAEVEMLRAALKDGSSAGNSLNFLPALDPLPAPAPAAPSDSCHTSSQATGSIQTGQGWDDGRPGSAHALDDGEGGQAQGPEAAQGEVAALVAEPAVGGYKADTRPGRREQRAKIVIVLADAAAMLVTAVSILGYLMWEDRSRLKGA